MQNTLKVHGNCKIEITDKKGKTKVITGKNVILGEGARNFLLSDETISQTILSTQNQTVTDYSTPDIATYQEIAITQKTYIGQSGTNFIAELQMFADIGEATGEWNSVFIGNKSYWLSYFLIVIEGIPPTVGITVLSTDTVKVTWTFTITDNSSGNTSYTNQ